MNPYRDREAANQNGSPQSIPLQDLQSPGLPGAESQVSAQALPITNLRPAFVASSSGTRNLTSLHAPLSPPILQLRPNVEPMPWTPIHPYNSPNQTAPPVGSSTPILGLSYQDNPLDYDDPFVQRAPASRVSSFDQNAWNLSITPSSGGINASFDGANDVGGYEESLSSPPYGDRTPLTGSAQPIGTSDTGIPSRSRSGSRRPSFLGSDLSTAEAGLRVATDSRSARSGSFSHHLSPSSGSNPLQRAGTIMKNMSQRVVNISNEPKLIEKHNRTQISRQGSASSARSASNSVLPISPTDGTGKRPTSQVPNSRPVSQTTPFDDPEEGVQEIDLKEDGEPVPTSNTASEVKPMNPLRGRSLGIFASDDPIRMKLADILVHPAIEPFIFLLIIVQTCLLTAEAWTSIYDVVQTGSWPVSGLDFSMLAIFGIYTLEIVARIIVSGFVINPIEYSTINRQIGLRKAFGIKWRSLVAPYAAVSGLGPGDSLDGITGSTPVHQQGVLRTFTTGPGAQPQDLEDSRHASRARLANRAFLRHSFNRLDFVAVVAFWIDFCLRVGGAEDRLHLYLFRMLSALRILRLLLITSGTTIILRSLKKAAPLLVHVAFLICFFWLLFAIIGVQSFKSSLRRECVWIDPDGIEAPFLNSQQYCGGHLTITEATLPWVKADMVTAGAEYSKGFLCPVQSLCVEGSNPYGGTVGFDNILQSLQLVFVIMSSNTWSDIMYYLMDSDYVAAALYFAAGLVILFFWMINLLVAVITTSFQVIRDESKNTSAFTSGITDTHDSGVVLEDDDVIIPMSKRLSRLKWFSALCYPYFTWLIVGGMVTQGLRSASMGPSRANAINIIEHLVTVLLDIEIFIRFLSDWREFWSKKKNLFDMFLAVVTTVILIVPIRVHHPTVYSWLTIFQIMRVYRVILAIPLAKDLLATVFGNTTGLLNLFLFTFLLTFLAALFASQMYRHQGLIPYLDSGGQSTDTNFATIYNSFLTMYTIMSSEGWTSVMYMASEYTVGYNTAWIGIIFFILWFILSNFIVLNMFIAVIQESFDVSEDEKRLHQVRAFLEHRDMNSSNGNLSLSTLLRGRQSFQDPAVYGGPHTEALLKDAVVKDFLEMGEDTTVPPGQIPSAMDSPKTEFKLPDDKDLVVSPSTEPATPGTAYIVTGSKSATSGTFTAIGESPIAADTSGRTNLEQKNARNPIDWLLSRFRSREPNPFYSRLELPPANEELDAAQMAREAIMARNKRKREQEEYLRKYPMYNVSLYLFPSTHPVRVFCQRLVGPSHGELRINGVNPSGPLWFAFSGFVYATVVAMVLLACVVTPLYQKEYFAKHGFSVRSWFVFADLGFATIFAAEAVVKIIADGLIWTPNAYLRGIWGALDTVVSITLWVNVIANLSNHGQVSRAVGAFKALRALRLLNVSDAARRTFHSIIIKGGLKIASAALVSLGLLIPFAIYGVNIFMGQLRSCTDSSDDIIDLRDCVGEFYASPYQWNILAPRVAANPYYNFDNFSESLFILFQIVSQEGWTAVMWTSQTLTGVGLQPQNGSRPVNSIFFVVFNLLGSVFVLTLFVSVFMRNYTEQTGVAFLTTEQRSWLELRKLLKQVSPSRRPIRGTTTKLQDLCYRLAVRRRGVWQRTISYLLVLHLILLCTESYPGSHVWDIMRGIILFLINLVFVANIATRLMGLGWARFWKSGWDIYAVFPVFGTLTTLALAWSLPHSRVMSLMNKLFLTSVPLLLIPRSDQLDQLFKTAAASLPSIMNLVATWFVLYLGYAIAFTQTLGLTKFGYLGSGNVNFRTVPKALILLFRTSIGEGWNELMENYAKMEPPFCTEGGQFVDGDCGSPQWSRFLFISWSIFSMYIFCNLLVSLIYESFSYVYQRSFGLNILSRAEIRRFKDAWAEFDPNGSGYISTNAFPRLLGELSGVFDMRIYNGEFGVRRIVEDCSIKSHSSEHHESITMDGDRLNSSTIEMDIKKLCARIDQIPVKEVQERRERLNMFYEEVLVSTHPYKGIAFTNLLMTLAHYKLIDDSKSLRLTEFLHRRARLQRVDEAVKRNIVRGFLNSVFWRRRLKAWRLSNQRPVTPEPPVDDGDFKTRISFVPSFYGPSEPDANIAVPEIVVTGGPAISMAGDSSLLQAESGPMLHPDDAVRSRSATVSSTIPGGLVGPTTSPGIRSRSATTSVSRPRSPSPGLSINPFADMDGDIAVSAWDRLAADDITAMDEATGRLVSVDYSVASGISPMSHSRPQSPITHRRTHSRAPSQGQTSSLQHSPERPSRTARFLSGLGLSRRPSRSEVIPGSDDGVDASDPMYGFQGASPVAAGSGYSHSPVLLSPPTRSPSDSSGNRTPSLLALEVGSRPRARTTVSGNRAGALGGIGITGLGLVQTDLVGVAAFLGVTGLEGEERLGRSSGATSSSIEASRRDRSVVSHVSHTSRTSGLAPPLSPTEPGSDPFGESSQAGQESTRGSSSRARPPQVAVFGTARARARAQSVRVQAVLSELDDSAWGGALKRSATRARQGRSMDGREGR